MPRRSVTTSFLKAPNTSSFTEVRVYRLSDQSALSFKAEVSGPIQDAEWLIQRVDEAHELFRDRAVGDNDMITEVGELRKRETKHFFTAPFAEASVEEPNASGHAEPPWVKE